VYVCVYLCLFVSQCIILWYTGSKTHSYKVYYQLLAILWAYVN
jgi:hypothetical protein